MSAGRHGTRRGALLLEVMLALAIFVAGGLAILGLVRGSMLDLDHARQTLHAADVARSAMSRIEAGLANPATLNGPVELWDGRAAAESAYLDAGEDLAMGMDDAASVEDPLWELEVDTAPSQFADLSEVTVRARRLASPGSTRVVASYTLRQLVRLGRRDEDTVGEDGALLEAIREGEGRR